MPVPQAEHQNPCAAQDVALAPVTLLEIGIQRLESGEEAQVIGEMRGRTGQRCAEGVFADLLARAYPERYQWLDCGLLRDAKTQTVMSHLDDVDWNRLHPRGAEIAAEAARRLGYRYVSSANDNGRSFAEIASALTAAIRLVRP